MEEAIKKAEILIEALPYIKAFHKKVTVIKYGGSILGEQRIRKNVLEDIVFLSYMGLRPILVHGGGPNISERMRKEGKKTDFVDGMRITDKDTLRIVEEELEKLNSAIVSQIEELGGKARGHTMKSGSVVAATKKKEKVDLGYVGSVANIATQELSKDFENNVVSVISPMGKDARGIVYNINADEVAYHVACSLRAIKFMLLTNVKGVMRNTTDEASFLSTIKEQEAKQLIKDKVIQEGMIPKIQACFRALDAGVVKAHIIDARIPHALLLEIFTNKGIGTEILP